MGAEIPDSFESFFNNKLFDTSLRHLESCGGEVVLSVDCREENSLKGWVEEGTAFFLRRASVVRYPNHLFALAVGMSRIVGAKYLKAEFRFAGAPLLASLQDIVKIEDLQERNGGRVFLDPNSGELTLDCRQKHFVRGFEDLSVAERLGPIGQSYCQGAVMLALSALNR